MVYFFLLKDILLFVTVIFSTYRILLYFGTIQRVAEVGVGHLKRRKENKARDVSDFEQTHFLNFPTVNLEEVKSKYSQINGEELFKRNSTF